MFSLVSSSNHVKKYKKYKCWTTSNISEHEWLLWDVHSLTSFSLNHLIIFQQSSARTSVTHNLLNISIYKIVLFAVFGQKRRTNILLWTRFFWDLKTHTVVEINNPAWGVWPQGVMRDEVRGQQYIWWTLRMAQATQHIQTPAAATHSPPSGWSWHKHSLIRLAFFIDLFNMLCLYKPV